MNEFNYKSPSQNDVDSNETNHTLSLLRKQTNISTKYLTSKLKTQIEPIVFLLQGDSTGNGETEWFYKGIQEFAKNYPNYTFKQSLWDIAKDMYETPKNIQLGALGESFIHLDKVAGQTGSVTYASSNFNLTNDLDLRVKVSIDNWADLGTEGILTSRFDSGNRSWALGIASSTKIPYIWWSEDGTNLKGGVGSSSKATQALTIANEEVFWLRVTVDVNNGASGHTITYYTSVDGFTWAQLGNPVIGSGVTSFYNGTSNIAINGRGSADFTGNFYQLELRNGIDGAIIASPMAFLRGTLPELRIVLDMNGNTFSFNTPSNTSETQGSPVCFILNASASGMALGYSSDVTRFKKQTPIEPDLSFISYSHNEGGAPNYPVTYPAFINQLKTKYPIINIIPVTQNPKKDPSSTDAIGRHAIRNGIIVKTAGAMGLNIVDAYQAFLDTGNPNSYVSADGIHPTQAGFDLWKDVFVDFLNT